MKMPLETIWIDEILVITEQFRAYYPSCYALLEETPLYEDPDDRELPTLELNLYLETIQTQWQHLIARNRKYESLYPDTCWIKGFQGYPNVFV